MARMSVRADTSLVVQSKPSGWARSPLRKIIAICGLIALFCSGFFVRMLFPEAPMNLRAFNMSKSFVSDHLLSPKEAVFAPFNAKDVQSTDDKHFLVEGDLDVPQNGKTVHIHWATTVRYEGHRDWWMTRLIIGDDRVLGDGKKWKTYPGAIWK